MNEGLSNRRKGKLLRKYGFNTPDESRAYRLLRYHRARAATPNKQAEIERAFEMRLSKGPNENNTLIKLMKWKENAERRKARLASIKPGPALPHDILGLIYAKAHPSTQARMYAAVHPSIRNSQKLRQPARDHLQGTGDMQKWWREGPKKIIQAMGVASPNQKGIFLFLYRVIQALKQAYTDGQNLEGLKQAVRTHDPHGALDELSFLNFGQPRLSRASFVDSVLMKIKFVYELRKHDILANKTRTIPKATWAKLVAKQQFEVKKRRTEDLANKKQQRAAATKIQTAWREHKARKEAAMAAIIQRARQWRNRL